VRYRIDGDINRNWPQQDTLPLMAGTSHSFSDMGYIMKGSTFAYSFKTIANLGDENDSIIITPTFRYVREDGTVADWEDIKLYYHSPEDNELYVEYGSTRDTEERNATYVQLSGKMFQNSYYEDEDPNPKQFGRWLTYSAGKESISTQEYLYRDSSYYCMSKIKLPYTARMLSGEWEQLKWNTRGRGKEDNAIIRYSDLTYDTYNGYIDGVPNYTRGQSNWTSSMTEEFRDSMQTWFGEFHIPADLFVVDLKKHNLPSDFDLMEYMTQKGGIQEDDEIFDTDQGYLIINFDIKTKNGGKAHLQYDGTGGGKTGGNDMWATEGNPTTVQVQQHKVDGTVYTIPLESGDVGIIDMTLSINNRYGAAIFNIN
jgi:hypothetical protein